MSSTGEASGGGGRGRGRAARLPRWTRQEILVLIEGKRVVEVRGRGRGRGGGAAAEPTKWTAVAEYCRRHGVERGPVQCRKRWSNLAGDYKKIREWERALPSAPAGKEVSFWAMRNDARRERRLPGFFDREVYDILEGRVRGGGGNAGAAAAPPPRVEAVKEEGREKAEARAAATEAVFDSRRAAAAAATVGGDRLFSSEEEDEEEEEEATPPPPATAEAVPISEKTEVPRQESSEQAGTSKAKQPEQIADEQITEDSPVHGGQKRQRSDDTPGEATDLQGQLIEILDRSSRMVATQLEAQNINSQLDREQRKDQVSSLLGVLGKVADALYRIADKL